MDGSAWMAVLRDIGIPMTILAAVGWALWRSASWTANKVLHPLLTSHLHFMEQMSTAIDQLTTCLEQIREVLRDIRTDRKG